MRALCAILSLVAGLIPAPAAAQAQEGLEQELKDLNWVGFQQFADGSRVFVRTTEPVKYHIDDSKADLVVVTLENTRIPLKNNANFLDTRYFDSPVTFIRPRVIEGPSPSVRIEIRLRQKAPYKVSQSDTLLAIDFQRS